jgi:hypothetical protein
MCEARFVYMIKLIEQLTDAERRKLARASLQARPNAKPSVLSLQVV